MTRDALKIRTMERLRRWLTHPRLPVFAALLSLALTLPALGVGWQLDDLFHRAQFLELAGTPGGPAEVFSVITGDPAVNRELMEAGIFPWWTYERLKLNFWRPLSVVTHRIDYWLWPNSAPLMHAHSLAWLAVLVAAVAILYRRAIERAWIAGLAAVLFAVDDAHAYPAGWLANRNALLATTFGVAAIIFHDRWRAEGWRPGAFLAPFALAAALASAEFGAGALAYLLAYGLLVEAGDRASPKAGGPTPRVWRQRAKSMAPYVLVLLGYAIVHRGFGYGARGSGFYTDPLNEPAAFMLALAERAPVLLAGQWSPVPADAYSVVAGPVAAALWVASALMATLVALLLAALLRASAMARFWAAGMVLSLVPVAATAPSNRLLFFVGLGAMALLAEFVGGVVEGADWLPVAPRRRAVLKVVAVVLIGFHLGLAPLATPAFAFSAALTGEPAKAAAHSIAADPELTQQDLIVVNAPDHLVFVTSIPAVKTLRDDPMPRRVRALVAAPVEIEITRIDGRTIRVGIAGGMFAGILGHLFRGPDYPFVVGDTVELAGMVVEVIAVTDDLGPSELLVRFDRHLEDTSLRWVRWDRGRYSPFEPPAVGDSIRLHAPVAPFEMSPSELLEAYREARANAPPGRGSPLVR